MPKDTRGYNVARVIGLTGDEDLVDVRVSSNPVETEILELLSPCVTAANELKVKVTGDIIIDEIQVDNVQLIDDEGHELDFTASGAIQNYVNDGWDVAQGSTADTVTAPTTIGNLKALNAKDFATEATLTAAAASLDTIKAIDFAKESTLTATAQAIGTTSDTDSDTTVIGRLQKLITDLGTLADSKTLSDIITAIDYCSGISAAGAVGTLTATTTASAAIAGGTALANRKGMEILNNSANVVYWGYTDSVTTATGMPIHPGISKTFEFKPSVATAIYVIAASDSQLYIHEWK